MTDTSTTTLIEIGAAMFAVDDQERALRFYVEVLGFEVAGDTTYGPQGDRRWLEVAPRGSRARLALNPPMGARTGGGAISVECSDVLGEHARLIALGGVDVDAEPMHAPGAPLLFMLRDPDGNVVTVVQQSPGA